MLSNTRSCCWAFSLRLKLVVLATALTLGCVFGPAAAGASTFSWTASNVDEESNFAGLSCPSVSLCAATDQAGNILTSTNPTGGKGAWKVAHVDAYPYLEGISCASVSFCVAVDTESNILTSTNPTGGASAWTVTEKVDTVPPFEETVPIKGVSCPSTSLCVSGDSLGNILTSTNPTGGSWTITKVDKTSNSPGVFRVSCPSVSFCAAADSFGNVLTSTNPTGGASAWTVTNLSEFSVSGLTCQSPALCIVGSFEGDILTSTNPTGGAGEWHAVNIAKAAGPFSCPSATLCVGGNYEGDILTSANPTGGAGEWTFTNVDIQEIYEVSCPSVSLCIAVGSEGNVDVGTGEVPPINTHLPVVSGPAEVGVTLFCGEGSWSGPEPLTFTYQWQRDGTAIGGAVGQTYLLTTTDQGHTLTCTVTAHNGAGTSSSAVSAPTEVIQAQVVIPPEEPKSVQCAVPKLKGKTLTQAKRLLTRGHCKLGKVTSTKKKGKLKVVSQKPGPGRKLSAGSKVAVKLG